MNKKVLIIEDEKALLIALVDKFIRAGFTVLTATNGKNGLKSAFENHPDIIILDIIMPVMDGISALDELRKDPWGKKAKVILLTNLSNPRPDKITESLIKTTDDYMIKSDWKISDVVKQVTKILSK